jgi:hypothetical protein
MDARPLVIKASNNIWFKLFLVESTIIIALIIFLAARKNDDLRGLAADEGTHKNLSNETRPGIKTNELLKTKDQEPSKPVLTTEAKNVIRNFSFLTDKSLFEYGSNLALNPEFCYFLNITDGEKRDVEKTFERIRQNYTEEIVKYAELKQDAQGGEYFYVPKLTNSESYKAELEKSLGQILGDERGLFVSAVAKNAPQFAMFGEYSQEIFFKEYNAPNSNETAFALTTKLGHNELWKPRELAMRAKKADNDPLYKSLIAKFADRLKGQ